MYVRYLLGLLLLLDLLVELLGGGLFLRLALGEGLLGILISLLALHTYIHMVQKSIRRI